MSSEPFSANAASSNESKPRASWVTRLLTPKNLAVFLFLVLPLSLIFFVVAWRFARQNAAAQELVDRKNDLLASGLPIDAESMYDQ